MYHRNRSSTTAARDLLDLKFDMDIGQIAGPRPGLVVAMMRRIGAECGNMLYLESLAKEYADLRRRPPANLVVIEGGRQ